jgi:hypothetical protein
MNAEEGQLTAIQNSWDPIVAKSSEVTPVLDSRRVVLADVERSTDPKIHSNDRIYLRLSAVPAQSPPAGGR